MESSKILLKFLRIKRALRRYFVFVHEIHQSDIRQQRSHSEGISCWHVGRAQGHCLPLQLSTSGPNSQSLKGSNYETPDGCTIAATATNISPTSWRNHIALDLLRLSAEKDTARALFKSSQDGKTFFWPKNGTWLCSSAHNYWPKILRMAQQATHRYETDMMSTLNMTQQGEILRIWGSYTVVPNMEGQRSELKSTHWIVRYLLHYKITS
jgi:hypothetical protein